MAQLARNNPDCWYGVEDPKKRKQIQDRLAQRARRKRLAQQRPRATSSSTDSGVPRTSGPSLSEVHALVHSPDRSPLSSAVYVMLEPQRPRKVSRGSRTIAAQIPLTVYAALYNNGMILGLTCATVLPQQSSPAPHAPEPLQPTNLQLETVHLPWIDRFPLARLRQNMILKEAEINEEEFLYDMFNMDSFTIKDGRPGWDPGAWVIGRSFAKKWGYLLT